MNILFEDARESDSYVANCDESRKIRPQRLDLDFIPRRGETVVLLPAHGEQESEVVIVHDVHYLIDCEIIVYVTRTRYRLLGMYGEGA